MFLSAWSPEREDDGGGGGEAPIRAYSFDVSIFFSRIDV